MTYARVALLSPPFSELTYALPDCLAGGALRPGQRVAVPLGSAVRAGVLLAFSETSDLPPGVTARELIWPLENRPLLSEAYLKTIAELALRQAVSVGRVLGAVLPAGLKSCGGFVRWFNGAETGLIKLVSLKGREARWLAGLGEAWRKGEAVFIPKRAKLGDIEYVQVCKDPPWPLRPTSTRQIELMEYLWEQGGKTRAQLGETFGGDVHSVLAALVNKGLIIIGPRPDDCYIGAEAAGMAAGTDAADFLAAADPVGAVDTVDTVDTADAAEERLEALVESLAACSDGVDEALSDPLPPAGLSEEGAGPCADAPPGGGSGQAFRPERPEPGRLFNLSAEQAAAVAGLEKMLASGGGALLHGVTGSGKTAVYLELAAKTLTAGRNVILLAPEVALACKLEKEARKHLPGAEIHLSHGYQSSDKRERLFRLVGEKAGPFLICGTRSSLFLPLADIGLIVMDEEHDASFKQDEGLAYQAKEVAWYLSRRDQGLLLLGSATPDVRTYYASLPESAGGLGQMALFHLHHRLNQGGLPELRFVDIGKQGSQDGIIAPESMAALKKTLSAGRQAVILLNRRGYSPLIYCLDCGQVLKCPHCEVGMTFHKARGRLLCHYCGESRPFPQPCSGCGGAHYLPMGEGTEKVAESLLTALPPGTRVLRLDRDTTRRPGRAAEILAAFARGEAEVLVGTQMLSKGHHFPKVTLAIVADADLGLNLPDYQAAERTFQLIMQSAGRAGRGDEPGQVIVQTRDPGHFCWQFISNSDYQGFFERELALRRQRRYPPFVRLGLIRLSYPAEQSAGAGWLRQAGAVARALAAETGVSVLGPAPAPLAGLRGQRRYQCLLKADNWLAIRRLYAQLKESMAESGLALSLDLDPENML